jgi:glycosyltransferase involved in cell wall biosynthesis
MKIIISLNTAWNLLNFRAGLIRALVRQGHEVVAIAPADNYAPALATLGCRFVPIAMDQWGTHPGQDLLLLWRYWRCLRREQPGLYLGYTVKPNVYGSLAAHCLGIPVINNIAGLGSVFIRNGWMARLVRSMYKVSLRKSASVFFQNQDDQKLFIANGLVLSDATQVLPGSGIDLDRFRLAAMSASGASGDKFRFLLVARLLWDKGLAEYLEAAKLIRQRWPKVECCLLGFVDTQNPSGISKTQLDAWVAQGHVTYLGVSSDVRPNIAEADCIVLPSYREGTPRSLLEAAAMGRPIITTEAVGCRDVVEDGVTGYLCRVRDGVDLAAKMERMLALTDAQRALMGARGRAKMERQFDERIVIEKYLQTIETISRQRSVKNGGTQGKQHDAESEEMPI